MGKQTNKRKVSRHRSNPIGARVAAGVQEGVVEHVPQPEQVLPVIQKLSSPDSTERAWSAACISNLVMAGSSTRKLLLSKGIVATLIERLTDSHQEVVEEALGTLRNLVAVDPDVAKDYYARDILTPLAALLPKISNTINLVLTDAPFADEADQERRRTVWDVAENFVYLIWSICEASDKYIKAINRLNIVTFLISFLSAADQCPTHTVVAAGQCLTTLTEDNKDIYIEFQNHPEYISTLFGILTKFDSPDKVLVRVLACAILMNVREVLRVSGSWDDEKDPLNELNKTVLPILISSLDYDIQAAAEQSLAAVQSGNVNKHEESGEITPKPKQPLTNEERYIQSVEERLTTLQLSLELLADICIQDESEEDGWEDADENMADDEEDNTADDINEDNVDDYLRDAAEIADGTATAIDDQLVRSNPMLHAFTYDIFPQLIRLSTMTPLSFPREDVAPTVSQGLALAHQRAFECVNNFFLAMNEVPSRFWFNEHKADACQAWRWLFSTANDVASLPAGQDRDEILEVIVGCLWSLGRGLGQNIPLDASDVPTLCGAYQAASSESMRVKIVGCLGPIALRQGDINTNKAIGVFVMEILRNVRSHQTKAEAAVEALNLIYDVYSDCAFDYDEPVFIQGNFLSELRQILPSVRSMVKSIDRRKTFDLRSRGDEALTNLVAFIKYKATEKRQ
ncbi:hypothetical protein DFQ28_007283 [Apophysomyces sp. BC1034]|nr:hypothetical protein DFQ30_007192 [Apophysomyces sp. BC1015]KAG0178734.1 hypothetical protein DFQ29_003066 [Apophysomyces sp. BC1021]KAG0186805.1 hypothetical protein DFQ28_007283 [Apophysomyces sp. BC1034]